MFYASASASTKTLEVFWHSNYNATTTTPNHNNIATLHNAKDIFLKQWDHENCFRQLGFVPSNAHV
jgi:hypothetical protein